MPVLLDPSRRWQCPACNRQHVTTKPVTGLVMHNCPALGDLSAPYVEVTGLELDRHAQHVTVVERDDYVGDELVTVANGRPVMAVNVERADGSNDRVVFAGTAQAHPHTSL